jgi:hypothetical protein
MSDEDPRWKGRIKVLPFERSFASNPSFRFFAQDLNITIDPRKITKKSGKEMIMRCPTCNHIFSSSPHQINKCKFCEHQALCENYDCLMCFGHSLASRHFRGIEEFKRFNELLASGASDGVIYPLFLKSCAMYNFRNNEESCRMIFKSSSKKECSFICYNCGHSFPNVPSHVEELQDCPFCSPNNAKMLCPKDKNCEKCFAKSFASHPRAAYWDFREGKNNGLTPHDVFKSGTHRADMICGECHNPFSLTCNNISTGFWCPLCKKKTEAKVLPFLSSIPGRVFKYQYNPLWLLDPLTNGRRSFDFTDVENKSALEIDGDQHFYDKIHWGSTGEENLEKDIQKMILAVNQKFSGVRIYQVDVLFDKYDWKKWIIDAFAYIGTHEGPIWVFPKNPQYKRHIEECISHRIPYMVL